MLHSSAMPMHWRQLTGHLLSLPDHASAIQAGILLVCALTREHMHDRFTPRHYFYMNVLWGLDKSITAAGTSAAAAAQLVTWA